jgi:hypothetical protein
VEVLAGMFQQPLRGQVQESQRCGGFENIAHVGSHLVMHLAAGAIEIRNLPTSSRLDFNDLVRRVAAQYPPATSPENYSVA